MALFDKLKEVKDSAVATASNAAQKAKEQYEANKQAREEKKAAEEAYRKEMLAKADAEKEEIINKINENYSDDLDGFFSNKSFEDVKKYSKVFFEKILLPASSMKKSYLNMYPYIDSSQNNKLMKVFGTYEDICQSIVHIKDKEGQEFLLTYENFYFKKFLSEDRSYLVVGRVPCSKISLFTLKKKDDCYTFMCDDVEIADLQIIDGREEDFITLDKFFLDVKNQDFEISDEEVDSSIRKKIGTTTYEEIKKYFVDEDELILFFAWGGDGSDYTVCTKNQIIAVDKQAFGYTANAKQFFYDDIKSLNAVQNTNDTSITGMLIDAALASVFKDCDLNITAFGSYASIKGMKKIEADRIVAIYNQFKKEIKRSEQEARNIQPQVIVQQQNQPDIIEQIEKLSKLKEAGILSEDEFNKKKSELLEKI